MCYKVDPPLKHHYTIMGKQTNTIINVCTCKHRSGDRYGDRYGVDHPLHHHYPFKDQKVQTIMNIYAFVNTMQKEMDMEMDKEMDI